MGEKDGHALQQPTTGELDARIREALIVARAAQREATWANARAYALVVTKLEEAVLWLHAPSVLA